MIRPVVWVADVGSIQNNRFGWCRSANQQDFLSGVTINELAAGVAQDLDERKRVALGFECPLFVPITADPIGLTQARVGEGNRPWSAGAGAGSLAIGLTECVWALDQVRSLTNVDRVPTLDWEQLRLGKANLFVWEAFVSAGAHGNTHHADAEVAARTFWAKFPDVAGGNAVTAENPFSLAGAALLRAGLLQDLAVLRQPCVVLRST